MLTVIELLGWNELKLVEFEGSRKCGGLRVNFKKVQKKSEKKNKKMKNKETVRSEAGVASQKRSFEKGMTPLGKGGRSEAMAEAYIVTTR